MRSRSFKIGIAVAVAAFLVLLISYISLSVQNPPKENLPITIRLENEKTSYALGEIVVIKAYLVNNNNETVKIYGMVTQYEIFNSKGESIVGLVRFHDYSSEFPQVLQPQSEIPLLPFEWEQSYTSSEGSGVTLKKVGPGLYKIKVTISITGLVFPETSIEKLEKFEDIYAETTIKIEG